MNRRDFLVLCTALACTVPVSAATEPPYPEEQSPRTARGQEIAATARSIRIERAIPYAHRPQRRLRLDVYTPKEEPASLRPAVLCFHLAAWAKDGVPIRIDLDRLLPSPTLNIYPPALVPRGYGVVTAQLRTSAEARFPAQIEDCRCALYWLLQNCPRLGVDPKRIGLLGASASGHLGSLLALTDSRKHWNEASCPLPAPTPVKAICSFAGFYDFELYQEDPGSGTLQEQITPFLGGGQGRIPHDLSFYRPRLAAIYEVFGSDRLLFGSNWTSSEEVGAFSETLNIVREYFTSKGREVAEKFFWKNSVAAYRWVKRETNQPR